MSRRVLIGLIMAACAAAFAALPTGSALAGNTNAGDAWVDNVGQPPGPGHEMDPHLACQDINLWGAGMADPSGSYTIYGWPPSGSQEQVYSASWTYDQSTGGSQVMSVIPVKTLIENAVANGDAPRNSQGFHFKLALSQDPSKYKTFWVDCQLPSIRTTAASATVGQPIHDVAVLSGGDNPTGTISWNVYAASDTACSHPLNSSALSVPVSGSGTYTSPSFSAGVGSYQWVATYSGDAGNLTVSTACNDPNEQSTVGPAVLKISTAASSGTIGGPVADVAVLSGGFNPTGTISWNVYALSDKHCSTPLNASALSVPVSGDGTYTSPDFTPAAPGVYQWVASYSGDSNNAPAKSACSDTNEQSTVSQAAPGISTLASSGTVGQPVHDVATLTGGYLPKGTISWNVYAAADTACSTPLNKTPLTDAVNGAGSYTSPDFTPATAGSYQWVATYSGDANNTSASTACNDPNEQSTMSQATPAISTSASSAMVGQPIHDVAYLTGGDAPAGAITWTIYSASDTACKTPLGTVSGMVNGDGTYTSPDFAAGAGSYQWVATYTGDANNAAVSTACNDPNEQSTVQVPPAPAISLVKLERIGSSGSFTHGPVTGNPGDTIDYQMTVVNTGNTTLVISFSDPRCDAGTLSAPTVLSGTFDPATSTLSAGGGLQYTCSHVLSAADAPAYTNTASVSGRPPTGSPVSATDSVVANVTTPGIHVVKLQRDGTSGAFTTSTITAKVGDTIEYEIQVTNTGTSPLTLSLSDPLCNAGTIGGPTALSGTLTGSVLSPGGSAQYTCSHVLRGDDASPFTNTATVTGQPPTGPPVAGTASVTANKQAVQSKKILRCARGKVKKTKRVHGKKVVVCVPKKKSVHAVVIRRRVRPPQFTG